MALCRPMLRRVSRIGRLDHAPIGDIIIIIIIIIKQENDYSDVRQL